MPIHFFKSKKSSAPKGNTIKKAEPLNGRPSAPTTQQSSFPGIDKKQKDLVTANEWIKEGFSKKQKRPGRRISVLTRTLADPYHAILVNGATLEANDNAIITELENTEAPSISANATVSESSKDSKTQQQVQPPMLDLLLGRQDPSSRYFTRRLVRIPDSDNGAPSISSSLFPGRASENVSPLQLIDYDPHAFELYKIWSHTGTLPTHCREIWYTLSDRNQKHTWRSCWLLMNAVILGSTIGEPDFTDRVMDLLEERVGNGVCADKDTIAHIFTERDDDIPEVLKRFVVDRCIAAGFESFNDLDKPNLPSSFINLALETALRRLSHAGQVSLVPGCEYHTHDTLESCYMRKLTSSEVRRMGQLKLQRSMSHKRSGAMATNSWQDNIKRIDWEQRRAGITRVVKDQVRKTGGTQCGFNGSDNRGSGLDTTDKTTTRNGTTSDVVDKIKSEPPTRAPPPPPSVIELQGSVAHVMLPLDKETAFQEDTVRQTNGLPAPSLTTCGSNSPHLSTRSIQSKPDTGELADLGSEFDFNKCTTCPGAFPESRVGSLKTASHPEEMLGNSCASA
ncbi:uncharacterized protein K460DRAFT_429162 [Cucurbitaria berberidis CBS 394.84]|uniref:Uncharacterized protein n=1 Tax=Cucurbitaria berberidis CBS 394.84 TaxID=1168544 RepID=A0A9P4GFV4_9PLEO|nr:uncharacterized protein K460DRAFT_429162 [Cucurbitaria berberidis CBS 394.84]KAF1844496.1 hypothetical protein K460DRAFT_429162 [Cucurbitaria berberidis CBS 394.84]